MLGCAFEGPSDMAFDPEGVEVGAEVDDMALRFDLPDDNQEAEDLEVRRNDSRASWLRRAAGMGGAVVGDGAAPALRSGGAAGPRAVRARASARIRGVQGQHQVPKEQT